MIKIDGRSKIVIGRSKTRSIFWFSTICRYKILFSFIVEKQTSCCQPIQSTAHFNVEIFNVLYWSCDQNILFELQMFHVCRCSLALLFGKHLLNTEIKRMTMF